ncbi:MGMT family protein [Streptomyces sp. LX-29]|nr:MGMT family protein [Streptomyces sp. LX-29]
MSPQSNDRSPKSRGRRGPRDETRSRPRDGGRDRPAGARPVRTDGPPGAELPEYAERVLEVVELIPRGRVMTYGDIAEWLEEGGPRQVGRVLALYGGAVPWWRVIRADGTLLPGHELRALAHYREEGTPLRGPARSTEGHLPRVDLARARWDGASETDRRHQGRDGVDGHDGDIAHT